MLISHLSIQRHSILLFICITVVLAPLSLALSAEPLRVVTENWYPFNYLANDGKIEGRSTDYVNQLLKEAEIDYLIEVLPWTRAMNLAETKANIAIYTILKTADREPLFHWICPIAKKQTHRIYKLSSRTEIHVNAENELKNYSVAVTRETFLHGYMINRGLKEGHNLQLTAEDKLNITLFLAGRVDLLAEFDSNIDTILQDSGLTQNDLKPIFDIPASRYPDYCLGISKQTPLALVNKIRLTQQRLQSQQLIKIE
jgi:polar amino acid transport system substrate-binding protein